MSTAHKIENSQETRIALLEQSVGHIGETLARLESKMEKGFEHVNQRFDGINNRIWFNFYWMIAGFTGVLGLTAHALHWIP